MRSFPCLCAALFVSLLALTGCNKRSARDPSAILLQSVRENPTDFVADVARARGLPAQRAVPFSWDDDPTFAAALAQHMAKDTAPGTAGDTRGFYLAFGFMQSTNAGGRQHREDFGEEVVDEQVVGFYDQDTGIVHIRSSHFEDSESPERVLMALAHEVGHALQHQHFGRVDLRGVRDDENFLSMMAVLEGDAMMTGVAYLAYYHRKSLGRILARGSEWMRAQSYESLLASDPHAAALRAAPANARERMIFPYKEGFTFMSDVFRTGGFDLVNEAFRSPPTTSEQVLHPNKYLAGEQAIPVAYPAAPTGWQVAVKGRVGELQVRALLGQCGAKGATAAAQGWGGDAYAIVHDNGNSIALLWSTVWDDEAAAKRFESALRTGGGCWAKEGRNTRGARIAGSMHVVREGSRVTFVRGLPPPLSTQTATMLLSLPGERLADKPPFGRPMTVRPVRPSPTADGGRIFGGFYQSEMLGLRLGLPPGFSSELGSEGMSLTLSQQGSSPALFEMGASDEPIWEPSAESTFVQLRNGIASQLQGGKLIRTHDGTTRLTIGAARVRSWRVVGTTMEIRALVVPICRSTGAIIITQVWGDAGAHARVDQILANLQMTTGRPPICDELNP